MILKRVIQKLTTNQLLAKLNNAYRVLLGGEIEQGSITAEQLKDFGELIRRDLVGFAAFGEHNSVMTMDHDTMLIMEGRRQVVYHMLKQLDITPREIIETLNDNITQNSTLTNPNEEYYD
jgi:hypothetical protein